MNPSPRTESPLPPPPSDPPHGPSVRLPGFLLAYRRVLVIGVHLVLWVLAFVGAFVLRFESVWDVPAIYWHRMTAWVPTLLVLRAATFVYFKNFQGLLKYAGARDLLSLTYATTVSTVAFGFVTHLIGPPQVPRSVFVIEWLLSMAAVGGLRFSVRTLREITTLASWGTEARRRILVAGAGDAGEMLVREIRKTASDRYHIVGFVDDNPHKHNGQIHGVPVLGPIENIPALVRAHGVHEVIVAIPSASGRVMRRLVDECSASGAVVRTIPSVDSLIDGRVTINQIRNVRIEDLLGREPIVLDTEAISERVRDAVVLITGAGGSIGSELCRQVCRFAPRAVVLVEQAENNLFEIHRDLRARFPGVSVVPVIADICDSRRMDQVFARWRPTLVFHAAAHKHVPMMEMNPGEAIKNNVMGTRKLADLADRYGVDRFVMISTDKAVNPTSVMGVSKRVAEIYTQALSQRSKTRFITVRFGNVLGSAGSVIPIFQQQIAAGGPVTVTHPEMKRYFMLIPEACQLVLQAGAMGRGGEIFVLDMGEPVKIVDLARSLITLSGLVPGEDVEIKFTGIRPGEKLFEELHINGEHTDKTRHPKIFVGRFKPHAWEDVVTGIDALHALTDGGDDSEIRARFRVVVPEYAPSLPPATAPQAGVLPTPPLGVPAAGRTTQPKVTAVSLPPTGTTAAAAAAQGAKVIPLKR